LVNRESASPKLPTTPPRPKACRSKNGARRNSYPAEPPRQHARREYQQPAPKHEEAAEHIADAVEREGEQVQRVGDAVVVLRRVSGDLPRQQAANTDVADAVEGNEHHAPDQHPRREETTLAARPSQQVIQSCQVNDETGDVEDAETEKEDQTLVVVVQRVRDLCSRVGSD
jgi:hypothetical protein